MSLKIKKEIYDEMVQYAISGGANEVCGYLAGTDDVASVFFKMNNVSETPETFFWMDPKEQFALIRELRNLKLTNMVCFHSHPKGGEGLSNDDKKILRDKNLKYIIISLRLEVPIVNAWAFDGEVYTDEEIEIL